MKYLLFVFVLLAPTTAQAGDCWGSSRGCWSDIQPEKIELHEGGLSGSGGQRSVLLY